MACFGVYPDDERVGLRALVCAVNERVLQGLSRSTMTGHKWGYDGDCKLVPANAVMDE
jgi:hypothetical protein